MGQTFCLEELAMRLFRSSYKQDGQLNSTDTYWIDFKDHNGTRRRWPTGLTNQKSAETFADMVDKLVNFRSVRQTPDRDLTLWLEGCPAKFKERLAKADLIDPERAAGSKKLSEHLEDFKQSIINSGSDQRQAEQQYRRVKKIFDGLNYTFWTDISGSGVQGYIAGLKKGKNSISTRTANFYIQAIKQFCRWMVMDRRATDNPLNHLRASRVDDEQKRRALSPDEVVRLLRATESEPKRYKMTGQERSLLYRLAVETGLRASELKALTVSCFNFKENTVTLSGKYTKNSLDAVLPLRKDTALLLRDHFRGKLPTAIAFDMPAKKGWSEMIQYDLRAAVINPDDNGEGKLVFHSLRHTFGTMLAASGVHPKTAQDLMRHSDINLTMSRYTHTMRGQQSQAINSLPDLSRPDSQAQKMTGTDDINIIDGSQCKQEEKPGNFTARFSDKINAIKRNLTESNGKYSENVSITNEQEKPATLDATPCNKITYGDHLTERAGFEPAVRLPARRFSKPGNDNSQVIDNKELTEILKKVTAIFSANSTEFNGLKRIISAWPELTEIQRKTVMMLIESFGIISNDK